MRFASLAFFLPAIMAFTIPENQADGVYKVSEVDGKEVHTLIGEVPTDVTPGRKMNRRELVDDALVKRGGTGCASGDVLTKADCDAANAGVDSQCGDNNPVGGGEHIYTIKGCAVAYFCNYSNGASHCSSAQRQYASSIITQACGYYVAGWTSPSDNNAWYGYENYCGSTGSHFCSG